jgi:hypothetical protein
VCVCFVVRVLQCVFVCVLSMGNLSANSIYIFGRVLSVKVTVNWLVRFILNLRCVSENKMARQSNAMRCEVAFVLVSIGCCQGE